MSTIDAAPVMMNVAQYAAAAAAYAATSAAGIDAYGVYLAAASAEREWQGRRLLDLLEAAR